MDQTFINGGLVLLLGLLGWLGKEQWRIIQEISKDMQALRERLASDFTPRQEMQILVREIKDEFRKQFGDLVFQLHDIATEMKRKQDK